MLMRIALIPSKNAKRLHHNFYDSSKLEGTDAEKHAAFLKTREEIKVYFKNFVSEYFAAERVIV